MAGVNIVAVPIQNDQSAKNHSIPSNQKEVSDTNDLNAFNGSSMSLTKATEITGKIKQEEHQGKI